jgi:hypothetical protein
VVDAVHVSLNIILDSIKKYSCEQYIEQSTALSFNRLVILPRDLSQARPECLYVGRLSEAMRTRSTLSGFSCVCLRDRIRDDRENAETLSGLIVVNENLELEQLFSELQDTFMQLGDWYQSMQDAVIQQKSIQDIITLSESVIGNFISISDSALTLVAYTKNIPTDDPTSRFLIENGYHSDEAVRKFKINKRFDIWMSTDDVIISTDRKISKYVCISKVFTFNDTYFMHVVMTCNHREMTQGQIDLFNHMICILSHYIKRNWEEKKNFDHVYSALIADLMQGKIKSREAAAERARMVGIRPEDEYIVMLLTGGGRGDADFPGLVAHDIANRFPLFRPVYYDCRLMLFLHRADIARYITEQDINADLNAYFRENDIFCGMSDVLKDLLELPEAYYQAEMALEEGGRKSRKSELIWEPASEYGNIAQFDTYFAGCLLDKSKKTERLWRSSKYGRMLLELAGSDIEKNANNLEVLYMYLINERRATETASALHMHRNNVVYRISRIEELLGISLEDTKTRVNLTLSLLMLRSTGILRESRKHGIVLAAGDA